MVFAAALGKTEFELHEIDCDAGFDGEVHILRDIFGCCSDIQSVQLADNYADDISILVNEGAAAITWLDRR